MSRGLVSILDGNTFVVSEDNGDIDATPTIPTGLFAFDTRYLSKWRLRINDKRLGVVSVDDVQYFEARFVLVPGAPTPFLDPPFSVTRQRSIGDSFHERLTVANHEGKPIDLRICIEVGSDFADVFEIKDVGRKKGKYYTSVEPGCLRLGYQRAKFRREAVVFSTQPAHFDEGGITFDVRIGPHGEWATELYVRTLGGDGREIRDSLHGHPLPRRDRRADLSRWLADVPRLTSDSDVLAVTYRRSLVDLAALRYTPLTAHRQVGALPAAGLPWFMSIFGRDTIFTSLQALPFAPDLAATALRILALQQGVVLDDFREEEPGKILHEYRYGETTAFQEQPHSPYYGSADATPLYVILLDEYERWTGDATMVHLCERAARDA
ncbi:glycogen debranching N-terminal domain-containing protein, partial [Micromonospora fulviviridis]